MDSKTELTAADFGLLWQLAAVMQGDYNHNFPEAFAAAVKKRDQLLTQCHGSGMFACESNEGKVYLCHDAGTWSLRVVPFD